MVREISERWKALVFAAVILVSVVGLFAAASAMNRAPPGRTVSSVSIQIDGPGWTLRYDAAQTANATVFGLLMEAADRLGFSVTYTRYAPPLDGVLVDSINGSPNGHDSRWWQFWVNEFYGDVGADRKALSDGDQVLWAFLPYPPPGGA